MDTAPEAELAWPDDRLVGECRKGSEKAWSALLDKYRKLVYSIPIKYGLSADDATEIFQAVFLDLLSDLPKLREPKALPAWLIRTAAHKCFHRRRELERFAAEEPSEDAANPWQAEAELPEDMLRQLEREQAVREALEEQPPRCRRLIHMLFFESPARPYQEIARSLGIATGSIGFIRGRCLRRLRLRLGKIGLP